MKIQDKVIVVTEKHEGFSIDITIDEAVMLRRIMQMNVSVPPHIVANREQRDKVKNFMSDMHSMFKDAGVPYEIS